MALIMFVLQLFTLPVFVVTLLLFFVVLFILRISMLFASGRRRAMLRVSGGSPRR